jgi:hypothetical protein
MTQGVNRRNKEMSQMATQREELPQQAADAAAGAAVEVVEVMADPAGATDKQVRRLERRGAPVNRRLRRDLRQGADQTARIAGDVLNGTIPERLLILGLRLVKGRARHRDLVGEAAYRSLELVHGGLGSAARSLARIEDASQPPVRSGDGQRTRTPIRKAAEKSASQTETAARRSAGRTRKSSEQASKPARRAPRRSSSRTASGGTTTARGRQS